MGKKGKTNSNALIIVIALVVLVGLGTLFFTSQQTVGEQVAEGIAAAGGDDACGSDNPAVDLEWRVRNAENSSTQYLVSTLYLEELNADGTTKSLKEVSGGGSATHTDSTDALRCGSPYRLHIKTNQDSNATALMAPIELSAEDTSEDPVIKTILGTRFSTTTMRVFDIINDGFMDTNETGDNTTTDFEAPVGTKGFVSTASDTAETVGADADYEKRFEIQTAVVDSKFGSRTLLCIDNANDANSNDWDEPQISLGGTTLDEMKATLNSNDLLALVAYEACYDLGLAIGESSTKVVMDMNTGSGVNPDYDWSVKLVGLGTYEDDDNPDKLLVDVGFRTNAARTELSTATDQRYFFDIS